MMNFLRFENMDGNEILINVNHIINFERVNNGKDRGITKIELTNGKSISINESLKQVENIMRREQVL